MTKPENPFSFELLLIEFNDIRSFIIKALEYVPDYFYEIPASSTGKYHPDYTLGSGGLYRHVQAAIAIAIELFKLDRFDFTQEEQDLIIGSIILHDCWKQGLTGEEKHTVFEHPLVAVSALKNFLKPATSHEKHWLNIICNNIASHMGQWNIDTRSDSTALALPKPRTKMQKFVHLCDYLASRKNIEVKLP